MREIKFKSWVENKVSDFCFMNEKIEFIGGRINEIFAKSGKVSELSDIKITYLQYIGIKDSEGKEIYEGDIVKYIGDDDSTLRVIEYKCKEACFVARSKNIEPEDCVYLNEEYFTVIGNIFENPEL